MPDPARKPLRETIKLLVIHEAEGQARLDSAGSRLVIIDAEEVMPECQQDVVEPERRRRSTTMAVRWITASSVRQCVTLVEKNNALVRTVAQPHAVLNERGAAGHGTAMGSGMELGRADVGMGVHASPRADEITTMHGGGELPRCRTGGDERRPTGESACTADEMSEVHGRRLAAVTGR